MLAVADRARFSDGNLDYMDKAGIRYIVAARLRKLPKEMRRRILTDDDFRASAVVDEGRIAEDARWDGIHGVITNEAELSAVETLGRYRGLWRIEDTFRLTKHDLKTRPIYHWTAGRIEAHILLCFVALSVAKQAVYRLAAVKRPMSLISMGLRHKSGILAFLLFLRHNIIDYNHQQGGGHEDH